MYCRDWEGDNGQERSKKGGKWVENIYISTIMDPFFSGLPKRQTCLLNKLGNKLSRPDIEYHNKPNGRKRTRFEILK